MGIRDETGVRLKAIIRILEEGFESGELKRTETLDDLSVKLYLVMADKNSHFVKKMNGLVDDYEYV